MRAIKRIRSFHLAYPLLLLFAGSCAMISPLHAGASDCDTSTSSAQASGCQEGYFQPYQETWTMADAGTEHPDVLSKRKRLPQNLKKNPYKKQDGEEFFYFKSVKTWRESRSGAYASVLKAPDGAVFLKIQTSASSHKFHIFSEPHTWLIVTDSAGAILAEARVQATDGARTNTIGYGKYAERFEPIPASQLSKARYAFFLHKHCAWEMSFSRTVADHNGCYKGGPGPGEIKSFKLKIISELKRATPPQDAKFLAGDWVGVTLTP